MSGKIVMLGYGLLGILFIVANIGESFSSEYLILGLALLLFGMSIYMDAVGLDEPAIIGRFFDDQIQIFAEDGLKLAGVVTRPTFFARYGCQKIGLLRTEETSGRA